MRVGIDTDKNVIMLDQQYYIHQILAQILLLLVVHNRLITNLWVT